MNEINDQSRIATSLTSKSQFIWRYGILGWGIPTAILWSLITSYAEGFQQFPTVLVISLMLSPIAGFLFGWTFWMLKELLWQSGRSTIRTSVDVH